MGIILMTQESKIEELEKEKSDLQDKIANQEKIQAKLSTLIGEKPVNPLIARVQLPGSTFQLPSRGVFYNDGELADNIELGEVHCRPMSTFDEILMKSPDGLFSGESINEVFKRCIPGVLKPHRLLAKDVDFLIVCLRKITYGSEVEVFYDHLCSDESKSNSYMVNIDAFISNATKIDPTTVTQNYTITLENGQVVKLIPTRFEDLIKIFQDADPNKTFTNDEVLKSTIFAIRSVIAAVDEVTDSEMIEEWITKIPAGWVAQLSKAISSTSNFGPEFTHKTKCRECGEPIVIDTPINPIGFFL